MVGIGAEAVVVALETAEDDAGALEALTAEEEAWIDSVWTPYWTGAGEEEGATEDEADSALDSAVDEEGATQVEEGVSEAVVGSTEDEVGATQVEDGVGSAVDEVLGASCRSIQRSAFAQGKCQSRIRTEVAAGAGADPLLNSQVIGNRPTAGSEKWLNRLGDMSKSP